MASLEELREERLRKLQILKEHGMDPYPSVSAREVSLAEIEKDFDEFSKKENIILAGRVMALRGQGALLFLDINDGTGRLQGLLKKGELPDDVFELFKETVDIGDFVELKGSLFVTKRGEKTIQVLEWKMLSKSIQPLPDKWHGISDEETRYRKRYLDILFDKELRELFEKKTKFWEATRTFMKEKGFFEVETPTLELTTGGAEANPFKTYHKDFDLDVYLRISVGELWQKRLMVAGYDKTFEIGHIYRNEGSSPNHLQEFTNMEFYWAYANYEDGMRLTQELYQTIAEKVFGATKFTTGEHTYDLSGEWQRIDYQEEVLKQTGIDVLTANKDDMVAKLKELGVKYEGDNLERLTDTLWKYCRKSISGPAFLINHPKLVSPLAKSIKERPECTERFQIIIAGAEAGNGYSELNNPIEQRARFEEQKKLLEAGDEEAMMSDWEFVEALEHGMPPTCGFGFGERLFAFMVNKPIREVQFFPLMKPKENQGEKNNREDNKKNTVAVMGTENNDLGLSYVQAEDLLDKYIKDPIVKLHCIESEAIMRTLAKHFKEDEEKWGIIGLLHDIDWDITKNNPSRHCVEAVKILKDAKASSFLIETIVSHCYGYENNEELKNKKRTGRVQHSLAAAETLTGLIISSVLITPDKKLDSVKLSSLKKRFKEKKFAANCNRNIILECEKIGLSIDEFLEIGLISLQGIAEKLKM